jgi:hypothetical protein
MSAGVIYTTIFAGRDRLRVPRATTPSARWVCFTDDAALATPAPWERVVVRRAQKDPARDLKPFKCCPHHYFPEADWTVWLDARFCPWRSLGPLVARAKPLALVRHPERNCVYLEAVEVLRLELDAPAIVTAQIERYRAAGWPPHAGLYSCGVLVRARDPRVEALGEDWLRECESGSRRDQLSFPIALARSGITPAVLPYGTIRDYCLSVSQGKRNGAARRAWR